MNTVFINKIGLEHTLDWRNCQDFGFYNENTKCVVDGCSEGTNSDVGAKLFCHLFEKTNDIESTFSTLSSLFTEFEEIKNHLLFTILYTSEDDSHFHVHVAGDGIIIKETIDHKIEYELIEQNNSPSYYAYNFVPKKYLKMYQDGVEFVTYSFSKEEYANIGIASDGLHYILNSPYKDEFETLLLKRKNNRIKLLINKVHQNSLLHHFGNKVYPEPISFKDDITIIF